jgi:putative spermidine/putrescine transport system substrate-binding protein
MVWKAKQFGGDERNIDAGFKAMGELAKNVNSFPTTSSSMLQLFQSKDVALGVWTPSRCIWARGEGVNIQFALPKEGAFLMVTTVNVSKNSPVLDLAYAYVNMELGVNAQANIGTDMLFFPMNKDAYSKLSTETVRSLYFTPDNVNQAHMADWEYIESVYPVWSERWEKEVQSQAQ